MEHQITIYEVGPRDGLQNEAINIPTETKIEFINALSKTGLKKIEATSFVSPKWVPQLSDNSSVMENITRTPGVNYSVLIPNIAGLELALPCAPNEIAVFTAASETFSQKNTNCTIKQSMERVEKITAVARSRRIPFRGYISCVLGCPYEGEVPIKKTVELAEKLIKLGCYQISLGDTIGVGTAYKTKQLIKAVSDAIGVDKIAVHFHDTYAQALTNIYVSLEAGVTTIDSSVGGLGGCPYAPGAGGNVATEDVVYFLNGLGLHCGIDLSKLMQAGEIINQFLKRPTRSKVALALTR